MRILSSNAATLNLCYIFLSYYNYLLDNYYSISKINIILYILNKLKCVLIFSVLSDFNESPKNITLNSEVSRSVVRLTCHINSIPEATITWQRNGNPLPHNSEKYIYI